MISFKKLTAQEMVDRGIEKYFYVNIPSVIILLMFLSLSLAITLSSNPVIVQAPYSSE